MKIKDMKLFLSLLEIIYLSVISFSGPHHIFILALMHFTRIWT